MLKRPRHSFKPFAPSRFFSTTSSILARHHYDVLGVPRDADKQHIKKAFYELSKKHHPDLNSEEGSHDKFVEINRAYEVLSDDAKRREYDVNHMDIHHRSHARQTGTGYGPRRASSRPFKPAPDNVRETPTKGFDAGNLRGEGQTKTKPHYNYAEWERAHGLNDQKKTDARRRHRKSMEEETHDLAPAARLAIILTLFTIMHLLTRVFLK